MSFIELPELVSLRGDKAIEALQELIKEFQQQKGKELTEKQAEALVKIANQLIWSIKAETYQATLDRRIKRRVFGFLARKTLSSHDSIHL